MDVLAIVDRAMRAEREAAAIYERFATLFRGDPALRELWAELATEERGHFAKLAAWRALLAREPAARRPIPSGYDGSLADLEKTLAGAADRSRCRARRAVRRPYKLQLKASAGSNPRAKG